MCKEEKKEVSTTKRDYQSLVKHNNLIKSRYTLEASEQKLLYKIFEHVQKNNYTTKELNLNFNEFMKEFKGVLNKNITKADFKRLVEGLQDKKPYIIIGDEFTRTQWYKIKGKINYDEIKLILDDDVFKYIQAQEKNFTMLRLESIYKFKKAYTFKIYELIKQWSNTKKVIIFDVDELKKDLDIEENKGYKNYSNIEKKNILPALKEINDNSELKVEYESVKVGRKVVSVKFTVIENRPAPRLGNSLIEVPAILKNGDEDIEVMQGYIDIDAVGSHTEEQQDNRQALKLSKSFTIPEHNIFNTASKRAFMRDFKEYDFTINYLQDAFYEAQDLATEKDNLGENDLMTINTYKWFKGTLKNKIEQAKYKNTPASEKFLLNVVDESELQEEQEVHNPVDLDLLKLLGRK